MATGAVITGKRTGDFAGYWGGDRALMAGVLDGIEIQLRPVLLGLGRRFLDGLPAEHIELELVRTMQAPTTVHLRYEVKR
jgi:hypothetical protein